MTAGTVLCQIYSGGVRRWSLPFLLVSEILNVNFIWKSSSVERGIIHLNYLVEWRIQGHNKILNAIPFSIVWEDIIFWVSLVEKGHFFMSFNSFLCLWVTLLKLIVKVCWGLSFNLFLLMCAICKRFGDSCSRWWWIMQWENNLLLVCEVWFGVVCQVWEALHDAEKVMFIVSTVFTWCITVQHVKSSSSNGWVVK